MGEVVKLTKLIKHETNGRNFFEQYPFLLMKMKCNRKFCTLQNEVD